MCLGSPLPTCLGIFFARWNFGVSLDRTGVGPGFSVTLYQSLPKGEFVCLFVICSRGVGEVKWGVGLHPSSGLLDFVEVHWTHPGRLAKLEL